MVRAGDDAMKATVVGSERRVCRLGPGEVKRLPGQGVVVGFYVACPECGHRNFVLVQGQQVFIVSWRNAGAELALATWDDYAREGVLAMLEATLEVAGARRLNALGFCVGGTLLASALAVMPQPERVVSLTLLATMLDFADVGEIGVYIDEDYVASCERQYRDGGLVPGSQVAHAFATLRANELIWHFHVNNYLKGVNPPAFDLLFWNADSACCDFEHKNPDDVAYIGGLIDDISRDWPVDKNQVFVLGHSNGGYMAYRMACERADVIAAIGSLAGNASSMPSACTPSQPVGVVHMHGTIDDIVPYSVRGRGRA